MTDIGIRWEGRQWVAHLIEPPAGHFEVWRENGWSTGCGDIEPDEVMTLFRRCDIMFFPAAKEPGCAAKPAKASAKS